MGEGNVYQSKIKTADHSVSDEQILAVLVGMADIMMVSSVSEAAVSGVSLVDSISILIINIFAALATGGAVVAAQYLGRQQEEQACIFSQAVNLSTMVISAVIMVPFCFLVSR